MLLKILKNIELSLYSLGHLDLLLNKKEVLIVINYLQYLSRLKWQQISLEKLPQNLFDCLLIFLLDRFDVLFVVLIENTLNKSLKKLQILFYHNVQTLEELILELLENLIHMHSKQLDFKVVFINLQKVVLHHDSSENSLLQSEQSLEQFLVIKQRLVIDLSHYIRGIAGYILDHCCVAPFEPKTSKKSLVDWGKADLLNRLFFVRKVFNRDFVWEVVVSDVFVPELVVIRRGLEGGFWWDFFQLVLSLNLLLSLKLFLFIVVFKCSLNITSLNLHFIYVKTWTKNQFSGNVFYYILNSFRKGSFVFLDLLLSYCNILFSKPPDPF